MKRNTLKEVFDFFEEHQRSDLKVKHKYKDDHNFFVVTKTNADDGVSYEVTFSKGSGLLSITTESGSRVTWSELQFLLSLDKHLEELRWQH